MLKQRDSQTKSKKSLNKSVSRPQSSSASKRKTSSNHKSAKKKQLPQYSINLSKGANTKKLKASLVKKKIEDLKTPDLIIKVSYKGKRISIPIYHADEKSLKETVAPQIIRFQKEVLKNSLFSQSSIQNWKTIGQGDALKDFYFQTNKPISVFKGQVLQIEPIWKSTQKREINLESFEIIKCIGTGGFSRVFLARFKSTGKFYALKLMEKQGLLETGKQCVVTNERDIMVDLDNQFVVNLDFAFETKHFVALALQYCPGGELFYYLRKVRRMTEDEARYCFIEILTGIQYLHSKKIVYRDIKPENIMIDEDGNLKIADFGLSKMGLKPHQMAYTYCGSPEYMAPQMLTKSGHNFSVDYYCLGALLYELVTGNPPFYSRDVDKIYYSIQNQEIEFPPNVQLSDQIKMLLEGLLIKDPKRRLGSMGGVRQIFGHPWVRKLKISDVIDKVVQTPIKINILSFNINEEEIQEGDGVFELKLQNQTHDFQPLFEDFYFARSADVNILDEVFPSVKSDSTKQNKSLTAKYNNTAKSVLTALSSESVHSSNKRAIHIKSSLSREKRQKFSIDISKKHPSSQINRDDILKPKGIKLKKQKSKKQLNLVKSPKKRPQQKSIIRMSKVKASNKVERAKSPKNLVKKSMNTLKRIKSSTALINPNQSEIRYY